MLSNEVERVEKVTWSSVLDNLCSFAIRPPGLWEHVSFHICSHSGKYWLMLALSKA